MVSVRKYIITVPMPHRYTDIKHFCDQCGASCDPDGTRHEKLYQYGEDQLCYECAWDALIGDGTIREVE